MKNCSICITITVALSMAGPILAAEKPQPVRMGCGLMTFDTVPGWGLRPQVVSHITLPLLAGQKVLN